MTDMMKTVLHMELVEEPTPVATGWQTGTSNHGWWDWNHQEHWLCSPDEMFVGYTVNIQWPFGLVTQSSTSSLVMHSCCCQGFTVRWWLIYLKMIILVTDYARRTLQRWRIVLKGVVLCGLPSAVQHLKARHLSSDTPESSSSTSESSSTQESTTTPIQCWNNTQQPNLRNMSKIKQFPGTNPRRR